MEALLAAADTVILELLGTPGGYLFWPYYGAASVAASGIFDNGSVTQDAGGYERSSQGPQLFVRLADLPEHPDERGTVEIGGTMYQITQTEPDGKGNAILRLRLASGA